MATGRVLATSATLALASLGALAPGAVAMRAERSPAAGPAGDAQARVPAATRAARRAMRERLGPQGLLATDPRRGTVRAVARLDGFLTGPSDRDGAEIAREYVRDHGDVFRLDAGDLAALDMTRRYRDPSGIEHIVWAQTYRGVPAIDSSLRANLTASGRIVNVTGGAVPDLAVPTTEPELTADRAHEVATTGLARPSAVRSTGAGPTRPTEFENGDRAELAIFDERLAWRVFVSASSTEYYDTLVDARTGGVLRRENRVKFQSDATVFRYHPGIAAVPVDLDPFLPPNPTQLEGPNAHAFVDRQDAVPGPNFNVFDVPDNQETPRSNNQGDFQYPFTPFNPGGGNCPPFPCGWNHLQVNSWQVNDEQSATQLFYLVNRFHQHLEDDPIGFDAPQSFEGVDPVIAQAMDGANTANGFPDDDHVNNANMLTLPDESFPSSLPSFGLMQMYLWDPGEDSGVRAVDGSDDASIVYHEHTHGLNNRLVTDPQGFGALGFIQSGAIDEGHADWYAMDFLNSEGLQPDDPAARDVTVGRYPIVAATGIRSQPMDCLREDSVTMCPNPPGAADAGGYTYGDFGRILGFPEVHADGEIWAQTLWDLRREIGSSDARRLVTNAMRLVPPEPSFLDMRNAILQADTNNGGGDRVAIWEVFAARGMGYFASTADASDTEPIESFQNGPPGGPPGTLSGVVTDAGTGSPLAGVRVAIGGHDTGLGEDFSATTAADGTYSISDVPQGTYPKVMFDAAGYDRAVESTVQVSGTRNAALRRNFALASGGATIASFTGNDYTQFGCGPSGLIDGSGGSVWGSDTPRNPPGSGSKQIVVRLPQAITLAEVRINPSAGCGDDPQSSLGPFRLDVSSDGASFTEAASGTFTPANNGQDNTVVLSSTPSSVQFIRLRALDSQSTAGTGNAFVDVAELKVFGAPASPAPATSAPPTATPPPPPPSSFAPPAVPLRFLTRRVTTRRDGSFIWRLAGQPGARGTVTFTALVPRRGRRALRLRLASRRFTIPRSGRLSIRVRPSRRALRRLRRLRSVRVRASVRIAGAPARSSTFTLRLRLRR